ncbi:MAG: hypothetical protein CNCCGFBP_00199 [Fimbriimonadaceae bacterium]|nr:hypothetical protein [Fimbriimonadaceae bacterium]
MAGLTARKLQTVPSNEGIQADVALTEPNGDEHVLRCLCKFDGTTDIGDPSAGEALKYLSDRYGDQTIWALTRQVTLAGH